MNEAFHNNKVRQECCFYILRIELIFSSKNTLETKKNQDKSSKQFKDKTSIKKLFIITIISETLYVTIITIEGMIFVIVKFKRFRKIMYFSRHRCMGDNPVHLTLSILKNIYCIFIVSIIFHKNH